MEADNFEGVERHMEEVKSVCCSCTLSRSDVSTRVWSGQRQVVRSRHRFVVNSVSFRRSFLFTARDNVKAAKISQCLQHLFANDQNPVFHWWYRSWFLFVAQNLIPRAGLHPNVVAPLSSLHRAPRSPCTSSLCHTSAARFATLPHVFTINWSNHSVPSVVCHFLELCFSRHFCNPWLVQHHTMHQTMFHARRPKCRRGSSRSTVSQHGPLCLFNFRRQRVVLTNVWSLNVTWFDVLGLQVLIPGVPLILSCLQTFGRAHRAPCLHAHRLHLHM